MLKPVVMTQYYYLITDNYNNTERDSVITDNAKDALRIIEANYPYSKEIKFLSKAPILLFDPIPRFVNPLDNARWYGLEDQDPDTKHR